MDLNNLRAFVAVIDNGSVNAAANALHLTQSAVTKRLQALEQQTGTVLMDRIGRQLLPTEAGRLLLPRARQILADVREAQRQLDQQDDARSSLGGALSLATSHHIGLHRLAGPLRRFVAAHPQVELAVEFVDSEDGCRAVEQGQTELAIVTLPLSPAPALRLQAVWDDPLAFVIHRDHPLASRGHIALTELANHPAVLPDRSTFTHRVIAAALARADTHPQVRMTTNYLETIKMLVQIGLGWSALPATMVDGDLATLAVEADIELPIKRTLGIVTHCNRTLSRAAQALVDIVVSESGP